MTLPYFLGLPIWHHPDWPGRYIPAATSSREALTEYARLFHAVEGNSTFYGLPSAATVTRWIEQTPASFRFCCKFPRQITHERQLRDTKDHCREFFERLAPLGERLGPLLLQLPPGFSDQGLDTLINFLDQLPQEFYYAVEVRHRTFFAKGEAEQQLNRALLERDIDRVMLDSRALFSHPAADPASATAQHKKPRLPVHALACGRFPMIRFIGAQDLAANARFFQPWIAKLQHWIDEGRQPLLFVHTPNNDNAPELAQQCHTALRQALPQLTAFPGWSVAATDQYRLF